MTATAIPTPAHRGVRARAWGAAVAAWGVVTGLAPHVLHHVGPLAGAALLAGSGGMALFFALGLVLSLPLLRSLYRRFGTLAAPAIAVVAFATMLTVSSLVIAPRLTGESEKPVPTEPGGQPSGHENHHNRSK